MKPLHPGKFRHRIVIERNNSTTFDAAGTPIAAWATYLTVWASVEPLTGRELFQGAQVRPDATHKITIRYRSGITTAMRAKFRSRHFHFESVLDAEERQRELTILAKEEV